MKAITISCIPVGPNHSPLIIAEMSGNHNQSLDRALAIVDAAAEAGAHGLKIQTYTADTITIDAEQDEFRITDAENLWSGNRLYQLYDRAHTPWEWHRPIFERCRERGIFGFSTPFDASAVDYLEELEVPCYKIASFENIDLPLIRRVAATGKPIIMSTGMASVAELGEAVDTARRAGCRDIILLKCTSTYPASPIDCNLSTIPHLRQMFQTQVGLSDHTLGIGVPLAAVALGATVVEKHFTLDRSDGGVDAAFSLEPPELKSLVEESKRAWQAIGKITYGPANGREMCSLKYRRSLYVTQDMRAGDKFDESNLRSIRPGLGLPPKHYETLLGKKVTQDVTRGTAVSWELVE
ncbi:MAG: pseudaminic acid synthase [bacterium]